jgi:hypothetical protein
LFLFLWLDLDIEKKNGYWCSILDSNVNTWDKGEKRVYYFSPIRSLNITIVSKFYYFEQRYNTINGHPFKGSGSSNHTRYGLL